MILKALVTGKNRKVAIDICEHLENDRGYMTIKCAPSKTALFDVTLAELPRIVIICLGDETQDTVQAYNVLKNVSATGGFTTIVIANEDDEKFFIKYTELKRVLFLSRPVSLFALYEKLAKIEEELKNNMENGISVFREYINENACDGHTRKKILVVDDDTEQLIHIKEQLEEFYDVTPVKSGDAAFKYLLKHKPDLILLDYLMPVQDGPMVLRGLRAIESYADIPVIFLTGMTEKNTVIKTLTQLKPQGYLVKPARKSEIVAKIIDVLG
ncbi:MAG: response regulator [Lachnospiraceae bacterium]|nr:response regulator [Lachnospiraceae bacterium]